MLKKALTSTMEDYLEAIYNLEKVHKVARVKEIAQWMKVEMSSVSGILKTLAKKKMIKHEKHSYVELTPEGAKIARVIHQRHKDLTDFLVRILGMDYKTAEGDACRIEHAISRTTMKRLREFIEFIKVCPRAGAHWLEHFIRYCEYSKKQPQGCVKCLSQCIDETTIKIKELENKGVATFPCEPASLVPNGASHSGFASGSRSSSAKAGSFGTGRGPDKISGKVKQGSAT